MFRFALRIWTNNRCWFKRGNLDVLYFSNRCMHDEVSDPVDAKFLVRLLDITEGTANRILKSVSKISQLSQNQVAKVHAVCVKHGINNMELSVSPKLLCIKPYIMEQRVNFYKDIGCSRITPAMLIPFEPSMELTVRDFKKFQLLPMDADVTKNLLNCLHKPPPYVPSIESMPEDFTLLIIRRRLLHHYLQWKLELTDEQTTEIMAPGNLLPYQSFTLLRKLLDVLENDIGFTKEKIRRNSYLLNKCPFNTVEIIKEINKIENVNANDMLIKRPRILQLAAEMVQDKLKVLKELGVTNEAIFSCPDILTLSRNTIVQRIAEFKTIPELSGHWTNPRVLFIVFYLDGVKKRLEILKQLNVRCASLHILCCADAIFKRYILLGSDRTKGADIQKFLSHELDADLPSFQEHLKRHSFWCQIPLLRVQETVTFLKGNNYSNEDILRNIQIVFYTSKQIQKYLDIIDSTEHYQSWELTPARKLALCLYEIEKEYHFNGNGVWSCEQTKSTRSKQKDREYLERLSNM